MFLSQISHNLVFFINGSKQILNFVDFLLTLHKFVNSKKCFKRLFAKGNLLYNRLVQDFILTRKMY